MSTPKEIGEKLIAFCKEGKNLECVDALYSDDVESVEAMEGQGPRVTKGKAAVRGKGEWWAKTFEVKKADVEGPFPHGDDRFAVVFDYETKNRETGEEAAMREVGVFHVANDKIVREEFFYG